MGEQSSKNGFLMLTIAGILSKLLSVLYMPFLNSIIGMEGVGTYQQVYEVFTFVYALTGIGIQTAIAKYIAELSAQGQEKDALRAFNLARKYLFLIGVTVTLILMILSKPISELIANPNITYGLIALAPSIAITAMLSTYRGYYQGQNRMTSIAISQVVEQFFNIAVSLIFAALLIKYGSAFGAAGGTIGTGAGALVATALLLFSFIKNRLDRQARSRDIAGITVSRKEHLTVLLSYAFPIILSNVMQNLGALIDTTLISRRLQFSAGFDRKAATILYAQLGLYKQLYYVPLVIITALVTTVIPAISRNYVLKDRKAVKSNVRLSLRVTMLVIIPCGFGLSVLCNEIYEVLHYQGASLMVTGAFVTIFMAIVQTQSAILQGTNEFYSVVKSLMIGIVLKIVCNYTLVGIKGINIYGAIIGGYVCFVFPMIINQRRINKHLNMKLSLVKMSLKPLISSIFMSMVIFVVRIPVYWIARKMHIRGVIAAFPLVIVIIAGVAAYFYAIVELRGITKRDIDAMSPKLYRIIPKFFKKRIKA